MIFLAINTASSRTGIALFEDFKLLAEDFWIAQNDEAEKLMPAIDILLSRAGKTFADISRVYVVKGPGSFTGLRVGITTANTIAYLNQCELYGITTFDYWQTVSDLPLLIFAGRGGVYFEKALVSLTELPELLATRKIDRVFGDISDDQKQAIRPVEFIETSETFGQIMEKIIAQPLTSVKMVEPLYVKEPGISTPKKCST